MSSQAHGEALLRVKTEAVVEPNKPVTLAQLVNAHGLSPQMMNKMKSTQLSVAPALGERQEMSGTNISSVLRPLIQAERELLHSQIRIVIPKTVVINTTRHEVDAESVKAELLQVWQPLCGDCQLEIEALSLPRVADLKDWNLHLKAEMPRGSFSMPVDLIHENGSNTPAWISGRLVIKRKVPVAKKMINANDRITAKDFSWEYHDTSFAIDGVPTLEDLNGPRIKQGLRASEILWKNMLERERAIRRGEVVQIKTNEGNWEVSLSAVAQQDAYIGDVISLKNTKSNNVLMGQVVGQGEVELR